MTEQRCETCRFWNTNGIAGDGDVPGNSGECCRRAPVRVMADCPALLRTETTVLHTRQRDADAHREDARRVWPLTYAWDWCGEWETKGGGE